MAHLQIALDGVIDGGGIHIVLWHQHVDSDVPYGRLEVRLLCIYQQTDSLLRSKVPQSLCTFDNGVHLRPLLVAQHC